MEFTPKKQKTFNSALRHNPYASGGTRYRNIFKSNRGSYTNSLHGTPRDYSRPKNASTSKFKPRCLSRTEQIIKNSKSVSAQKDKPYPPQESGNDENLTSFDKLILNNYGNKTQSYASPLSDSDEDDYIFKSNRKAEENKENKLIIKPSLHFSPKKKPLAVYKGSKIAHDISPKKIQRAYDSTKTLYSFKSFSNPKCNNVENKENLECKPSTGTEFPHLIGFPNYGNTCYLNAVLQSLVGLGCFTQELGHVMNMVSISHSSISYSLWSVIMNRQKCEVLDTKRALRVMKENFEKLDGSFSGFKMQDANEFLTRVLDAIKDEIDRINSHPTTPNVLNGEFSRAVPSDTPDKMQVSDEVSIPNRDAVDMGSPENRDILSIFNTSSQDSDISLEVKPISDNCSMSSDNFEVTLKEKSSRESSSGDGGDNTLRDVVKSSQGLLAMYLVTPAKSTCDEPTLSSLPPLMNPIKQNFEFELLESYKCLGCSHVVGRKQHHFALYVNLPKEDRDSIQKAVEAYAREDHRELNCEKCGHKTTSVVTSFTKFPRILIVQMKRYEYKADLLECIKVSSKVDVNLWLHLSSLSSDSIQPPPDWSPETSLSCTTKEKPSTLSVRNLSSELNICDKGGTTPPKAGRSPIPLNFSRDAESKEDKEMEEVLRRSIEDQGGVQHSEAEASRQKEEEEFQKAIQLSLQDVGMSFSPNQDTNEESPEDGQVELIKDEEPGLHSYRLMSVISHFGLTTCTGHYVADVFNIKDGFWYHYDDESVSKIQENIMLADGRKKNGYIFFYVHNNIYQQLLAENSR